MPTTVLKPSVVLRRVVAGKIPRRIFGGRIRCENCGQYHKDATTESPDFWESGSYVWCQNCKASTLARPVFPTFEIDLSGERKKYPSVLIQSRASLS